jgi:hypothetical protein
MCQKGWARRPEKEMNARPRPPVLHCVTGMLPAIWSRRQVAVQHTTIDIILGSKWEIFLVKRRFLRFYTAWTLNDHSRQVQ